MRTPHGPSFKSSKFESKNDVACQTAVCPARNPATTARQQKAFAKGKATRKLNSIALHIAAIANSSAKI
ncbi:hypothetical protein GOP47_0004014 [Adiantum capillus-veneris]|uniref:Uncharacterized protein n=1 Tax=Adiantum capillus-veneris TaxID=13818 RepID=A0A9D4ZPB9_ADICA|nr:hypothetical protein GOP47_0004014 [Adiantum capillus-veneris]